MAIEGVLWAVIPTQMRRVYEDAFRHGDKMLHISGLFSVAIGVALIAFALKASN